MSFMNQLTILIIAYFVMMLIWRIRNGRKSRDMALCEFATDEDTGYEEFHPIKDGKLIIEPTKKRSGAEYIIGGVRTITVDWPQHVPFFLALIQVKVRKVWLDEQTAEPMLNRTPLLSITPQRLYNMDRERFTALATGRSAIEEQQAKEQIKGKSSSMPILWIVLLAAAGVLIAGLFVLKDYLAVSNAALGLP